MATNYPLLIFPSPTSLTRNPGDKFPRRKIAKPSILKQGERLFPKFTTLIETFDRQNAELQSTAEDIDPEQVLVFETIGSVDGFITAIKNVDGFEWMSEIDIDDITPSEDFHYALEHDREKHLSGKLYLTMTNKRALEQMLSFWRQYSSNSDYEFARGTTGFRDIFTNLKDIRRWDIQERLLETGAIRAWEENLIFGPSSEKVEIQLWFYDSEQKRRSSQTNVIDMIQEVGGTILSFSIIPEISYHAILADIPTTEICKIISSPTTRLVGNNHIMFFRANEY